MTLPEDANIYAKEYKLYLPDKKGVAPAKHLLKRLLLKMGLIPCIFTRSWVR